MTEENKEVIEDTNDPKIIEDEFGNKWCNCDEPDLVPNRLPEEMGLAYCLNCHENWYH